MLTVHSLVRRHFRVLMCRESNSSPIPPTLSADERDGILDRFRIGDIEPCATSVALIDSTDFVKTGPHFNSNDFAEVELDLMRWGQRRFSFYYEGTMDERVNIIMSELFWTSFYRAVKSRSYKFTISQHVLRRAIVFPVLSNEFKNLQSMYRAQCNSLEILDYHCMVDEKKKAEYSDYLVKSGVSEGILSIFQPRNHFIMGNKAEVKVTAGNQGSDEVHVFIPRWWSEKTVSLMKVIEGRVHSYAALCTSFPGSGRIPRKYVESDSNDYGFVPRHLPSDMYSDEFKDTLLPSDRWALKMKPMVLPEINRMETIFPSGQTQFFYHIEGGMNNDYYTSDEDISCDELELSENEDDDSISPSGQIELKRIERLLQDEISTLKENLNDSNKTIEGFQNNILNSIPLHLEELKQAREDITKLKEKIESLEGRLELDKSQQQLGETSQADQLLDSQI
ncbi:uncharacterized protein MELLADRAFT_87570 [Melampsora larici-populina 98AG31]|uniref:Uncharacterized protein n=1 Tax=Melampsora larici-populina (strain 98AG31 / pathotype 3-4-7) TaxID=747676 RepID=F4SDW4_MELLP|nr:uncharacterized protein MELLADRAFT_87570 [Melampsora larici-populina 98AG31]EGF97163.1 hypothetical protein MELLADRAFT_87570 [Melampsora larici-populina 98AG31]